MPKFNRLKISLTNDCNLCCAHCYLKRTAKSYIDTSMLFRRLDEAVKLGFKTIDLTGGEPTMHPDFMIIVEYIKEKGLDVHICTNGINLSDKDLFALICKYKIQCNISLDGVSPEVCTSIRGINVYEKLSPTFKELKMNKVPFFLRFSINKRNMSDLQNILKCVDCIKPNGVLLNITQNIGNALSNQIILSELEISIIKGIIGNYLKKASTSIHIEECFTHSSICDGSCLNQLSLSTDGKPVACFMIPEFYGEKLSDEVDLLNLWKSILPYKKKLRNFKMTEKCSGCVNKEICNKGCLVTAASMGCL